MFDFIKKVCKRWFRNGLSLLVLTYIYPGFIMELTPKTVVIAAVVLTLIQLILQPLLKMLFLPINVITLGMFKWLLSTTHLLILSLLVTTIKFIPFSYQPFSIVGIPMPGGHLNIIFSLIIGTIVYKYIRMLILFFT